MKENLKKRLKEIGFNLNEYNDQEYIIKMMVLSEEENGGFRMSLENILSLIDDDDLKNTYLSGNWLDFYKQLRSNLK